VKGNRYADYEAAGRVLKAIEDHRSPSLADVIALRLWAMPRNGPRPLQDIANEIVKANRKSRWM
jgi:hypothetical protein